MVRSPVRNNSDQVFRMRHHTYPECYDVERENNCNGIPIESLSMLSSLLVPLSKPPIRNTLEESVLNQFETNVCSYFTM